MHFETNEGVFDFRIRYFALKLRISSELVDMLNSPWSGSTKPILSDSQIAIQTQGFYEVKTNTLWNCLKKISKIGIRLSSAKSRLCGNNHNKVD